MSPQPAFQSRNGDWSNPAHAKDERYVPAVVLKDREQQQAALNAEAPGVRAVPSTRLDYEVAMQPMTGAPVTYAEILAAVEVTERICSEAFYAYSQEESLRIHSLPCERAAPANAVRMSMGVRRGSFQIDAVEGGGDEPTSE